MVEIVKTLSGLLNPNILVENIYAFSVLAIFLTVYGPRLHTRLPPSLMSLFDSMIFRSIILFLILYMSNRDFVGALTIVIIFSVTMNIMHTNDVLKNLGAIPANIINTGDGIVNNSLNSATEIVSDVGNFGANTLSRGINVLGNTGINTGTVLSNTVDNLTGLVGNTLENVNGVLTDTVHNTAGAVKTGAHHVAGLVDTTTGLAANTLGDVADLAADTVGDAAHAVSDTVGDVAGLAADTVGDVGGFALGTAAGLMDVTSNITGNIIGLSNSNIAATASLLGNPTNVEHFSASGPPVSKCAAYDTSNSSSNVHYPLNDTEYATDLRGGNNGSELYNATF